MKKGGDRCGVHAYVLEADVIVQLRPVVEQLLRLVEAHAQVAFDPRRNVVRRAVDLDGLRGQPFGRRKYTMKMTMVAMMMIRRW